MEGCFMFQWGGVCFSDGEASFLSGGGHPMGGASVLMGGGASPCLPLWETLGMGGKCPCLQVSVRFFFQKMLFYW